MMLAMLIGAGCGSTGPSVARLGCDQYCQQAGASEGATESAADRISIDAVGTIVPIGGDTIPITVTCKSQRPCRGGALLLAGLADGTMCAPQEGCVGRTNVDVAARSTRVIGVPIASRALALLRSFRRMAAHVLVEFPPDLVEESRQALTVALDGAPPPGSLVVGAEPRALALAGGRLWIAHRQAGTVSAVDARSGRGTGPIAVGDEPVALAAEGNSVWVVNHGFTEPHAKSTLTRIDERSARVSGPPVVLGETSETLAAGSGSLWVGGDDVTRIDPEDGEPFGAPIAAGESVQTVIGLAEGDVWVSAGQGVYAIDAATGEPTDESFVVGRSGGSVVPGEGVPFAADEGVLWVANGSADSVNRYSTAGGHKLGRPIPVGQGPKAIAVGEGCAWVANSQSDTVTRIDARTGAVLGTIGAGLRPEAVTVGEGSVWVANSGADTVTRIDARTGKLVQ